MLLIATPSPPLPLLRPTATGTALPSLTDLKTAGGAGNSYSYLVLLETCMTTEEEAPEN